MPGRRRAGQNLVRHGLDMAVPAFFEVLGRRRPEFIADLRHHHLYPGVRTVGPLTAGEIAVTEILPILDRAVFRLTSRYEGSRPG